MDTTPDPAEDPTHPGLYADENQLPPHHTDAELADLLADHTTDTATGPARRIQARIQHTDVPQSLADRLLLANALARAQTGFLPKELHGKPADILVLMCRAWALDIPLAAAWDHLYETDDGTGATARLKHALARRAGHSLDFVTVDDQKAEAILTESDGTTHTATFTVQDAVRWGLTNPEHHPVGAEFWRRMPDRMLAARVITLLLDRHIPEVALGLALPDADADSIESTTVKSAHRQGAEDASAIRLEQQVRTTLALDAAEQAAAEPDGATRLTLLRNLRKTHAQALDLITDHDGKRRTVSSIYTALMLAADDLREQQRQPDPITTPPDPVHPIVPGGDGTFPCGCDAFTALTTGHQETCTRTDQEPPTP